MASTSLHRLGRILFPVFAPATLLLLSCGDQRSTSSADEENKGGPQTPPETTTSSVSDTPLRPPTMSATTISTGEESQAEEIDDDGAETTTWQVIEHNNREYVSAENIKAFYHFDSLTRTEGSPLVFSSKLLQLTIQLTIQPGTNEASIGGVRFFLSFPSVDVDNQVLVSRLDLTKLIDPVLRPTYSAGQPVKKSVALLALEEQESFALVLVNQLKSSGFATTTAAAGEDGAILIKLVPEEQSGTTTWCLTPPGAPDTDSTEIVETFFQGNRRDTDNISLATAIHAHVFKATGSRDGGIRRLRSATLQEAEGPAIQITVPHMESESEEEKTALAISKGLERFYDARSRQ